MKRKRIQRVTYRRLDFQTLEPRLAMASVGWDGPGLGSAQLTYNIANNSSSLTMAETKKAIETALSVWSSVAKITFTPTSQRGLRDSIDISFIRIDGPNRTLAQAYFPDDVNPARIAGDVQFDSSESWEIGNARGSRAFDLVWVAVHELGHSLGLDHLRAAGSVLSASVSASQPFVKLTTADIAAIQRLYAASGTSSTTTTSTPPTNATTGVKGDESGLELIPWIRWWQNRLGQFYGDRLEAEDSTVPNAANSTDVRSDAFTSTIDTFSVSSQSHFLSTRESATTTFGDSNTEVELNNNLRETGVAFQRFRFFGETVEDIFDRFDKDSNEKLSEDELSEQFWAKLKEAGLHSDGVISVDELAIWLDEQNEVALVSGHRYQAHHQSSDSLYAELGRSSRIRIRNRL